MQPLHFRLTTSTHLSAIAAAITALTLALASFVLAFLLLAELGFMVAYFASGGGGSGWWGHAWQKFLRDVIQPGPMAALGGWTAVTAGTGFLGYVLARPDRRTQAAITVPSMASLLGNCGMIGAGVAFSILFSLACCRVIWLW